jgi:CRP/FNR family cyclic AMP-dependent transcriptional regulator
MSDSSLPCNGVLANLSAPEREELARYGTTAEFTRGECPVAQGESHDRLFVILRGKLRVLRDNEDGEAVLADLRDGDIFGEMSILDRQPASATVRALGPCDVWYLSRTSFVVFLEDHATIGQKLLLQIARLLTKRLRHADSRVPASEEQLLDGWW